MLQLFVYGTLKLGFWNHDRYCKGVVLIEEAEVLGRLFALAGGEPLLDVPPSLVLAEGTLDPRGDALLQREEARNISEDDLADPEGPLHMPEYGWGAVKGEILHFNDPLLRLPSMDRLEGYCPGVRGAYRRLLYPARSAGRVLPVWLYAGAPEAVTGARLALRSGKWPS
ncbi:MAG: gamma-glutamylcyclotransferase [Deltaproteobacteria bacterium]|jgi:gamma-glutamylcyclotransferase (GGCT)/AIG2-like uncharacterized protein YtfP|nr:gamma-glutamylcyclotransferase [Deltaproteobacteria bacterium]